MDNNFNPKNSFYLNEIYYNNQKSYSSNTVSEVPSYKIDNFIQNDSSSTLSQSSTSTYVKVQFHPNRTLVVLNSNKINIAVGDYVATEADRGYDIDVKLLAF